MYIRITYPTSNAGRDNAVTIGFNKYAATSDPTKRVYSSATHDMMVAQKVPYHNARLDEMGKNAAYYAAVRNADLQVKYLHQLESECIQIFNFGIVRIISPLYLKTDRSFFGLPIETGKQPKLTTEAEVMNFAVVIFEGDALRMAVPGANPILVATPVEIEAQRVVAQTAIDARGVAKEAMDTADRLLVTLNVDFDLLILQMWKETETFYATQEETAKRNSSRDWGVVYVTYGSGSVITFTLLDFDTHLPIDAANGKVNENGDSNNSNAEGVLPLHTAVIGSAHITFTKPGIYQELVYPLVIVDESNVSYTVYLKKVV
jgi:hypothetical protein